MTTTATHNGHDTTPERALFVALALSEKTWKLGCTTGHGQKPRERSIAACTGALTPRSSAGQKALWPPRNRAGRELL